MPRLSRKNIQSNYLHIIVQGIDRKFIFNNSKLKQTYKNLLKKYILETNIEILAYCIMDNHVHILVYGEKIDEISKLMQRINTSYAKFYNSINKRVGFVFRDRYYSQPILSKNQLFNCLVYIHNNPVKAKMVKKMEDYPYSSYLEYYGEKDLISNKSIKLIFDSYENYIKQFNIIHKNYDIEDIIEVIDNYKSSEEIIREFINNNNKKLEEIKNEEELFGSLLIKLRHEGGSSLREMAKIFNINKDKLAKIINRKLKE